MASDFWLHEIMEQHAVHMMAHGNNGHTLPDEWRNCKHHGCLELKEVMNHNSVTSIVCHCDFCRANLTGQDRYDGATRVGAWAVMCVDCFRTHGLGLGIGIGQRFNADGICVEGNKGKPSPRA